ncbi:MAG: alpha/beta fold hydrolase [Bryobacterales bacterium]|nr:alpha/beta fold hydrolase [Bryobacterales bacterium]
MITRLAVAVLIVHTVLALAGCALLDRPAPVPRYDAKAFFETTAITGASFSHDEERILISTDATGVFNVYSQPFGGGAPEQLTNSGSDAAFAVSWFPNDDRFLYTADQGGNELNHLYVQEVDGSVRDVTPGERLKAMFRGWSGDRRSFWVLTNERDPRFFDLYRYQADTYERELFMRNEAGWMPGSVSRNGRWVSLDKPRTNADSDIYIWDSQAPTEPAVHITAHEGNANHRSLTFSPDSREFYYLTDLHGEFRQVWKYDLEARQHEVVVQADWDVSFFALSETGRYRVTGINQDARTVMTILDTVNGEELKISGLRQGDLSRVAFSRSESRMAFYVSSDSSPPNLHVLELEDLNPRRLTSSLNPAISPDHLVDSEVVRYESYDGLEIPSLLYKPKDVSVSSQAPALVWVHGGPGGQSRKGYSPTIQHLVNHGYAVLAVNNRGSSGYGKTFHHMDDRRHGDVDLKDCVWARRYLSSLDWVDSTRIGIIGGSYGGYMVAAALAFEPDAFDVGVNIFGVTNWVRTLESIPPWWEAQKESLYTELGDPATDGERLRAISPLFHAENISKPLLVVQGANDPRVLQAESDELVEAVRQTGVPVEYVLFQDEGHGFRKRANRIAASSEYVQFLNRHLKGESGLP